MRSQRVVQPVAILRAIHWMVVAMSQGRMPLERPDHRPWMETDAGRASLAGCALACRFCVLTTKGDWMEFASSLGFPAWNAAKAPCIYCKCGPGLPLDVQGVNPRSTGSL
eukprot:12318733-Alexandrium_andersonii.AAC.1